MRILIYDNNKQDLEKFCNMINLYPIEIIVNKASNYNDMLYFFNKHYYDKIFIDYNDDIGKKILNTIIETNPHQKIFLLSDKDNCPLEKNCELCKDKFRKSIIIKPLSQNQLTKIISRKFTCENEFLSTKEFNLKKIKKKVQIEYPYLKFEYCKDRDSFLSDNIPTAALVFVTDLLIQHDITFQVTHKNQIIIQ
ncbi:hypothetical protein CRV01_08765 [Arcobacter sp. CECT 8983]|uniref:hypothetical protein n=1 Tax=Arcobacter sp. CECT 8983 TaxID=2044508 RepID=UPI00100BEF10|nr:hypothetical protein [Arcobacter sp. CECT 8983]RXJ88710.1 hypothetical protein CRV01_08765 [Arcobacter sp. CECT 8983]